MKAGIDFLALTERTNRCGHCRRRTYHAGGEAEKKRSA
jgi:hypothetical protein